MVTPAAPAERWRQCKAARRVEGVTGEVEPQSHSGSYVVSVAWGLVADEFMGWPGVGLGHSDIAPAACCHLPAAAVVGCVAASAILFCGLTGLHGLPGVAAWPETIPDAQRPPTRWRARTACSAYSFSRIAASVPAHGIGDCAVSSERTGMEGNAPGRAEPPDTGGGGGHVCAGLLRRQLPRSAWALPTVSEHFGEPQR